MPAVFGLLPWHWRWLHVVPIEGVVGRLISGLLVVYLNIQGAWVVARRLPAPASTSPPPSASATVREIVAERWAAFSAFARSLAQLARGASGRSAPNAKRCEQRRPQPVPFPQPVSEAAMELEEEPQARGIGRLLALFRRHKAQRDPLDDIPAFQREPLKAKEEPVPITQRKQSIWERGDDRLRTAGARNPSRSRRRQRAGSCCRAAARSDRIAICAPRGSRGQVQSSSGWPELPNLLPSPLRTPTARLQFMSAPMPKCAP